MKIKLLGWLLATITSIGILIIGVPYFYLSRSRSFQEILIPAEGYQLHGLFSPGNSQDGPWVILAHGNRKEGQESELYRRIRENISEKVSVLALDFRGFGGSSAEGLEREDKILARDEDLDAAIAYLVHNWGAKEDRMILIGHSLGATEVMRAALDHQYQLVIPIGLGDWDILLSDKREIMNYAQKFQQNTGVIIQPDRVIEEGVQFTPQALFSECPETPVWLVFASFEDSRDSLKNHYESAYDRCDSRVNWSIVPFSDHMYGTEQTKLPGFSRIIFSKLSSSFLMWRLNQLINLAD